MFSKECVLFSNTRDTVRLHDDIYGAVWTAVHYGLRAVRNPVLHTGPTFLLPELPLWGKCLTLDTNNAGRAGLRSHTYPCCQQLCTAEDPGT